MHVTSPEPGGPPHQHHAPAVARDAATFALAVLFGMNLLNYVDRYVFFSVGELIQRDLHINDRRYAILSVSFMVVYTVVSPLIGFLGDRYSRPKLLALGVGLWSLATLFTAFTHGFRGMFFWRSVLGIGEATYGVIAPALLADLFAPKDRGRVMGLYTLALPLGGALGYALGGRVGTQFGWHAAFLVVGLPGFALALLGLLIRDPGRGASDRVEGGWPVPRPTLADYRKLMTTRSYLLVTAGMATVTFVSGAYAAWGSTFYQRVHGLSAAKAGAWIGGLTALAGLTGIALGTYTADWLLKRTPRAYLLMAAVAVMMAVPFGLAGILDPHWQASAGFMFAAMVLMASVLGPCNAVIANVVPANARAAGFAMSIFLAHLFGDISSPLVVGELSTWLGRPHVATSAIGQFLAAIGARPIATPTGPTNLTIGMLSVIPVMALGGLFFLVGSRYLERDQARAHQASSPAGNVLAHAD
jgi:MFS family permease